MKLAVIGSRDFNDQKLLEKTLDKLNETWQISVVVSGGARGADSLAETWAKKNKIETLIFKPDWDTFGKSAGYRRNLDIITNSDKVLAFQVNKSRGTQHSIDIAKKQGKEVFIYEL